MYKLSYYSNVVKSVAHQYNQTMHHPSTVQLIHNKKQDEMRLITMFNLQTCFTQRVYFHRHTVLEIKCLHNSVWNKLNVYTTVLENNRLHDSVWNKLNVYTTVSGIIKRLHDSAWNQTFTGQCLKLNVIQQCLKLNVYMTMLEIKRLHVSAWN